MKFPNWLKVYGDLSFRGDCPQESVEQATLFNQLPDDLSAIALHIKNEGKRNFRQMAKQRAEGGFIKGASDIIIPGSPTFVAEMKRRDHTKSSWKTGQLDYLKACQENGAFVCVALGYKAALEAVDDWMARHHP